MHLIVCTSMTIDEVEEQFDLPRLAAFGRYCQKYPPTHILLAGFMGYKGKEVVPVAQNDDDLENLMSQFSGG